MDWETLYCPHRHCRGYGKPFSQGYLVKNGTSRGQPRAWCKACEASVVLSYGTAYYGLEADPAIFETAVRALAEGNALRATARIVQVDKDTVCAWLHRVACHCRTVMLYFWHDLHVSECQLDELWSFVHTKEAHLPGAKLYCDTYGDAWVWIAFAPVWRLVLAFVIGKRDQAGADLLLARVAHVTDDSIPLFTSDQLPAYRHALLNTYGEWYHPPRQGQPGRLSQTAAAATSQSAVRTGRQTAQGRAHCGREHTGRLRYPRSGGSKFGPLACQLDRQHQLCRAGQPDTASE